MDKFRLRTISLGKIKEMRVKMNKTKKSKRNDSCMSHFLSSPFSPADLAADSSAGENVSLYKRDSSESKLHRASSEKLSCLTVSVLNQCIGEQNQGRLQNDKELKILGKDFKKQMKENKSLTLTHSALGYLEKLALKRKQKTRL